jgi:aryl-alcohol dehydrogenase-like predicted oxidoreductase
MSEASERRVLGRTGLEVGRLGVGSSYGAPASAYEQAFERGVNYFYYGSLRRGGFRDAVRALAPRYRDRMVIVVQSYARFGFHVKLSVHRALRSLGIERADALLLGLHNDFPAQRLVDAARELREEGKIGHLALSGHRRTLFPELVKDPRYGILHVRYNAVHRGAEVEAFPAFTARETAARPGLVSFTATRWGSLCDPKKTPPGERTPTAADCYRFVLSNPAPDVVLCGPSNAHEMTEALAALDQGPLDEEEQAFMRRVGDYIYRKR